VQSRPINLFYVLSQAWIDSGLVVTSTVGTVIEPRDLNRLFDELITKAGVRRIRFHDLRHTCASLVLAPLRDLR
jgi:integrase